MSVTHAEETPCNWSAMKTQNLFVRVYGERQHDQWTLMCLDYSLVVQADTLLEAKRKLNEQMRMYLRDALVGQDRAHAADLLLRRAPLRYWVKFYWHYTMMKFREARRTRLAERETLPMVPAAA